MPAVLYENFNIKAFSRQHWEQKGTQNVQIQFLNQHFTIQSENLNRWRANEKIHVNAAAHIRRLSTPKSALIVVLL